MQQGKSQLGMRKTKPQTATKYCNLICDFEVIALVCVLNLILIGQYTTDSLESHQSVQGFLTDAQYSFGRYMYLLIDYIIK